MAEEGPGARRLSPHNKDPSLVTSYLPPNLQKAPCVPYKAPAPAACSAARRDGGSGGGPPPLPPGPPPPAPPLRGRAARRGRSRPRPAPAAAVPSGPRCAAPAQGGTRGRPGTPVPAASSPLFLPPLRLILLTASPGRCPPGVAESPEQSLGCPRGRSPRRRFIFAARPPTGRPQRGRSGAARAGPGRREGRWGRGGPADH